MINKRQCHYFKLKNDVNNLFSDDYIQEYKEERDNIRRRATETFCRSMITWNEGLEKNKKNKKKRRLSIDNCHHHKKENNDILSKTLSHCGKDHTDDTAICMHCAVIEGIYELAKCGNWPKSTLDKTLASYKKVM